MLNTDIKIKNKNPFEGLKGQRNTSMAMTGKSTDGITAPGSVDS